MPRGSKTAALSGPWLGMEERENFQTEAHCQLALNVDFSRGYIEARQGFRRVAQTAPPRSRLHVHREDGEPKYLLSIGVIPAGGFIEFQVHEFDSGGSSVTSGTTQDITAVFGEPADQEFDCSFVSVILVGFEDPSVATPTKTKPNHVTLITTKHQTYVFNPVEDSSSLRKIDMTQEAIQLNSLNWGYWNVVPQAPIATEHQSRVYYAGISKDFDVVLTSPLDELQTLIPDMLIDQVDKSVFTLGQQFMAWSDEFDPLGIVAYHFAAVEEHEKITGLRSFQEQLVIFTDRSIYVKTGGTDETFQIFKVVSDVGCVAPHSIVEVGGVLMFMAKDGIYAFTGAGQQGAVQKISAPINSIFTGRHTNTYIPEKTRAHLYSLGFPFSISSGLLSRSQAVHVQSRNQIWWSVCTEKINAEAWNLTLVYDYQHQAWSLFTSAASTAAAPQSCMYDGVTASFGGKERVFVSSPTGGIFEYTGGHDEYGTGSSVGTVNVNMIYITGRLFKENNAVNLYRPMRLKMLSPGSSGTISDSAFWMAYGEEAHADSQFVNTAGTVTDAASTDRQYTEGTVELHPAETSNFFYNVGTYSGGNGELPSKDFTYQDQDWFTSKVESASIRSRSLRLAFFSGYGSTVKSPELTVQSIFVEVQAGDSR